ncbi:MAG: polysaccharide deacetylase family protein [Candidatus Eisenbacteria bacterium]|nr:polysaccharide deacetylase family protein [Candidatus Eisenbacteria bacterium]
MASDRARQPRTRRSLLRRAASSVRCSPLAARALSMIPGTGAVVLRYHSVCDDVGWSGEYIQKSLVTSTEVFDRQMCFLGERYTVVGVPRLAEMLRSGARVPAGLAAVTFDDGYEDNYRKAMPILRRHGLTATFYVTSGCVGDARVLWTVRLRRAVRGCSKGSLVLRCVGERSVDVSGDEAKERAIRLLTAAVKRSPPAEADRMLEEIEEACGTARAEQDRRIIMNEAELRELHAAGMTVGAHTVNHYNLTCLETPDIARELGESRRFLEGVIDAPVLHLAYPDGRTGRHFDGRVARVALEEGYRSAVTSIAGPASQRYPVLGIPRLGVVPSHENLGRLAFDMQRARISGARDGVFEEVRSATGAAEGVRGEAGEGAVEA